MEAPVEKKASVWEKLRSKNPLLFAIILVVIAGSCNYVGTGFLTPAFDTVGGVQVAWVRLSITAVVLLLWRQPWRKKWTKEQIIWLVLFAISIGTMYTSYNISVGNLAMGIAVPIQFLGPVAIGAITGKNWKQRSAIIVAAIGVAMLAGLSLSGNKSDTIVVGLIASFVAALAWAGYIFFGNKMAHNGALDALSLAITLAALVLAPFVGPTAIRQMSVDPGNSIWRIVQFTILASVIAAVLDQIMLKTIAPNVFSVLQALYPVISLIIGLFFGQFPTILEVVGLLIVSASIVLTALSGVQDENDDDKALKQAEAAPAK
ncbi:EamA family transporter [Bifidobacterium sp. 82T24]|uniref:EamA family transporter n=1 Tax=Bifidobacterium pluvialisilvae TaxID=2834436 RepID=UPI001C57D734|nr:EamA family transporter [Bifidobacterium pluvialisilvae]MBW3088853.1 EamA family transporter [Bifidobacterium pluvialisilvae]